MKATRLRFSRFGPMVHPHLPDTGGHRNHPNLQRRLCRRATTSSDPYTQIADVGAATVYVDSPADETYYYVTRAYYSNWESVDSNEDTATLTTPEDFDAIPAGSDNCPTTFNPLQMDTDGDGTGDACDPSPTATSTGTFTDSGQSLSNSLSVGVAFGDVDGDGDLDAMIANYNQPNTVWLNN